ncbi:hypothetical protein Tco_0308451 [Tanacetum coccineum]
MSSITAQQTKLDLELVPMEKRLDIGKCNRRLNPGKIQREPTFQVVLDALSITLWYSTFLITADVPEVDKKKRFKVTLDIFRDIFKICPRVQGQEFDALLTDEEIVSFLRDLGHTRSLSGKTSGATLPKKARKFKKLASPQLTIVPVSTKEPMGKSKRVKRPAKKSTKAPARGVVIRETPEMPLYKKKEKVDVTRGKGIKLLSQVALNEDA